MTNIKIIFGMRVADVEPLLKTSVPVDNIQKTLLHPILEELVTSNPSLQYIGGDIDFSKIR